MFVLTQPRGHDCAAVGWVVAAERTKRRARMRLLGAGKSKVAVGVDMCNDGGGRKALIASKKFLSASVFLRFLPLFRVPTLLLSHSLISLYAPFCSLLEYPRFVALFDPALALARHSAGSWELGPL